MPGTPRPGGCCASVGCGGTLVPLDPNRPVVVDVGCLTYSRRFQVDESLRPLLRRFRPGTYIGFDVKPGMLDGMREIDGVPCWFARRAAWTQDGVQLAVVERGNCTHVVQGCHPPSDGGVESFDLGTFLLRLPNPILKIDVEGAEYPILHNLHERGIDHHLELLLVEWHTGPYANGYRTERPQLACPVEEWH
jgi:hypothetical protein